MIYKAGEYIPAGPPNRKNEMKKQSFDEVMPENPGALRVWWIPQIPGDPFHVYVDSPSEAKKIATVLAGYDQFQFEHNIKPDYSNAGGLEVFEDGEWNEWEDRDGNTINDFVEIGD